MLKTRSGFTIVELLIVIVVIAILAAISVVAYNGIQQRAQNGKTHTALTSWIKAMKLYKVNEGHWPNEGAARVCLGDGYLYGVSGTDASGTSQCRVSGVSGVLVNNAFNTSMQPYLGGNIPTPAMVTARSSDTEWRRGLHYYFGGGAGNIVYIDAAFSGTVSPCPTVGGEDSDSRGDWNGNTYCHYQLGLTTDTE